ncbi:sporulation protein [Thermoactinomyces vulgaris]|uniref:Sporulation protein n=1 Tax=Thermoactinomyces vulgaris TaxID=2026 RepID=A0ABS0QKG9_THEVU|nr:sporulation protein [Thermoactinomyces vulgaris]MBA4552529.1 sporulation protein [Thermoactinomyces vulgaris]MBA4597699.1 sporulation protein [Thermoactinomyces vulgaris]MBH8589675.1 sporulation protein [Thermoactinomyces vulgaris]RMA97390.1 sporulation-control protein [Thermoactinomyces vulgaris]
MFNKVLAGLGVGAAKVDTRLEKSTYRQGEMIKGEIFIQGGQTEQRIDEIYLYLIVRYHHEGKDQKHVISQFRITDTFEIGERESRVIPFEIEMPLDAPISTGGCPIYLKTGLDIKMAIDPKDTDGIEVLPHPLVDKVLHAAENVGFRLTSVDYAFDKFYSRHPFVQEYRMTPMGKYEEYFDDISMVFYPDHDSLDVIMTLDRKAIDLMSSMEEALNLDERLMRFTVTREELEDKENPFEERFTEIVEQYI